MAIDFRLLDPNAANRGVQNVNGWADAAAMRAAGRAIAENDQVGAEDILNRNGLLGQAMNVRQNVWAEDNRRIAAEDRARKIQAEDEKTRLEAEAREAEALGTMATNLQQVLQDKGAEAVLPAFDSIATTWVAKGATPEQITQMREALAANPEQFLTAVAGASSQAMQRYRMWNAGGSVGTFDTRTGAIEEKFRAPDFEQVDPTKDLYYTPGTSDGPAAPSGGTASAPSATVEAMLPITLMAESGNKDRDAQGNLITSSAGAQGRMQVMPDTNRDPGFGVTPAKDGSDEERARVGRDYLAAMMRRYGNDPAKAWAAYNWGPGNLDRALQRDGENYLANAPKETRDYVRNNMAALGSSGGTSAPSPAGGPQLMRRGTPRPSASYTQLSPEEAAAAGFRPGTVAQRNNATGQVSVVQGPGQGNGGGGGGGSNNPRLSPQDNIYISKARTAADELRNTADLYQEFMSLNRQVQTGGWMALPGMAEARGALDPRIARMNAIQARLTPQQRQGMPGAASDRDVAMFTRSTVSADKPLAANEATARAGRAMATRQGDYVAFLENYARDNGSILGAQEQWNRYLNANPLFREEGGQIRVNAWKPWRGWFNENGGNRPNAGSGASTPSAPARSGSGQRRRYNPATGRIE